MHLLDSTVESIGKEKYEKNRTSYNLRDWRPAVQIKYLIYHVFRSCLPFNFLFLSLFDLYSSDTLHTAVITLHGWVEKFAHAFPLSDIHRFRRPIPIQTFYNKSVRCILLLCLLPEKSCASQGWVTNSLICKVHIRSITRAEMCRGIRSEKYYRGCTAGAELFQYLIFSSSLCWFCKVLQMCRLIRL